MRDLLDRLRVKPDSSLDLDDHDPRDRFGLDRDEAEAGTAALLEKLRLLQRHLYAESEQSLLLVLQAMDAAGKDGTIRRVFSGVNPQGVVVHSFKAPTSNERARDYLWRIHNRVPRRGEIGVFNRSHYEDVLVVRVRNMVEESRWRPRYRHIREFESMLTDEGMRIVKVFLNVSYEEQGERLQARIDDPEARWKFDPGDLDDRRRWADYRVAYEEMMTETSTESAPWYVLPADRKWVRDHCVMHLLVSTLQDMDPQLPTPHIDVADMRVDP